MKLNLKQTHIEMKSDGKDTEAKSKWACSDIYAKSIEEWSYIEENRKWHWILRYIEVTPHEIRSKVRHVWTRRHTAVLHRRAIETKSKWPRSERGVTLKGNQIDAVNDIEANSTCKRHGSTRNQRETLIASEIEVKRSEVAVRSKWRRSDIQWYHCPCLNFMRKPYRLDQPAQEQQ